MKRNAINLGLKAVALSALLCFNVACSNDESDDGLDVLNPTEEGTNNDNDPTSGDEGNGGNDQGGGDTNCTPANSIFNESDGLVNIEFENAVFGGDWELQSNGDNFSGDGYMVWTGAQSLNTPGNGLVSFKIQINNPGTYQFEWRTAILTGNSGTDHNDTWLRFPDADNFFGEKDGSNSIVFPVGTGKTPNPEGASADGWFKVYRSGDNLDFKWNALTNDHDGHRIYVTFDNAGEYTMEISARSSGHAIDKFVLFKTPFTLGDAVSNENPLSTASCN
ncbi:hypothetical protein [Spongiimicrobium salis]|uniref:hypothetical protein n=1 Tax=Spongiimicrobium salis TaxID=1667022 RepID=UPI00374D6F30